MVSRQQAEGKGSVFRPGSNPKPKRTTIQMTQADCVYSTPPTNMPVDPTRRRFLSVAAVATTTASQAGGSPPALTLIGGTAVLPTPAPRKARATAAEREAKAIQAGEMIERLLPAYVELHRLWAKGSGEAHAYVDANFSEEERYVCRQRAGGYRAKVDLQKQLSGYGPTSDERLLPKARSAGAIDRGRASGDHERLARKGAGRDV
jgi:hypothetical protein